ncbi:MAG: ATP-binding protein [Oscillospiraceae bacterium]|nr:ATP-binding protein [Oscillospiraceae bacterium]
MKELSLNILDIAMNSVKAGATQVTIRIEETQTQLTFSIEDNGCGMTPAQVQKLADPFFTSRTTRKVGLGVPFLKLAAEQAGGDVTVTSLPQAEHPLDHGTRVTARFDKTNIDYTPLGDIVSTLLTLIQGYPQIDFTFIHTIGDAQASLSTAEMRAVLGGEISLSDPQILGWVKDTLEEQYININQTK